MSILEGDGLTRILTPGNGGDLGGGGVLMGLILGAALGGNGGLFGGNRDNGERCINQADLNGQTLGDIKASVPLAEAQVQLALQGLQSYLSSQNTANATAAANAHRDILLNQCTQFAGVQRDIANVDTNVDRQSQAVQTAIVASERRVTDLITGNRIADLEQQLTVSQLRENEQRAVNREIVNTNTITIGMNQQQQQQQQQMQALQFQMAQLCGGINQFARATNSTVQVGNTGATTGGPQTANPTNVVA